MAILILLFHVLLALHRVLTVFKVKVPSTVYKFTVANWPFSKRLDTPRHEAGLEEITKLRYLGMGTSATKFGILHSTATDSMQTMALYLCIFSSSCTLLSHYSVTNSSTSNFFHFSAA
jgi:hypothetical protein